MTQFLSPSRPTMLKKDGADAVFQQGTSSKITLTFTDLAGVAVVKGNFLTLTMSLFNLEDSAVINSRNAVNVKDANGGLLDDDGTLTMTLVPADNTIVDSGLAVGHKEIHCIKFDWTWNDGVADRYGSTGAQGIYVQKLATLS